MNRFNSDEEDKAEREKREGFRAENYTGNGCEKCGRNRVMNCQNGKKICEKCGWDQNAHEYSEYLSLF